MDNNIRMQHIEFIQNDIKERGETIASDITFIGARYWVSVLEKGKEKKTHLSYSAASLVDECSRKIEIVDKKKIYISGKISGIENEAPELFFNAETELKAKGYETINPMTLNHEHDKSWHSYMKEDVKALCECDEIFMLSNWTDSKGAIIEHTIAMYLGLNVSYQTATNN